MRSYRLSRARVVLLVLLTLLYGAALAIISFLRQVSHSAPGTDFHEFIARANAEMWRMVAMATVIYAVACLVVLSPRKKT